MTEKTYSFSSVFSVLLLAVGIAISGTMLISPNPVGTIAITPSQGTPIAEGDSIIYPELTSDNYPSKETLVDLFPYLVEESIRFAGEQGLTETHFDEANFTYYSYNPSLDGIQAAQWAYKSSAKNGKAEELVPILEASLIPLSTGMPLSLILLSTSSILNNIKESDGYTLTDGVLEIALSEEKETLQIHFSSGKLDRIIRLSQEDKVLSTITYNYEPHPDLEGILLFLTK